MGVDLEKILGEAAVPLYEAGYMVVRRPADSRRSLVMVILIDGTVKTLWTNLNSDQHATLDSSKFSRPSLNEQQPTLSNLQ